MTITVLLVDDEQEWCNTVQRHLDRHPNIKVIDILHRAKDAVERARELKPDVILLDMSFPRGQMGGITAIKKLRAGSVTSKILVFSAVEQENKVYRALQAGANSYVLKREGLESIADAIEATYQGSAFCSPTVARMLEKRLDYLLGKLYGISLKEILRDKAKETAGPLSKSSLGR